MSSLTVSFHNIEEINQEDIKYVVLVAWYNNKLVLVRHQDRETLEIPGGHIELLESGEEAAKRELYEETGAIDFELHCFGVYSVNRDNNPSYGLLYRVDIKEMGPLPDSEIAEVRLVEELPENITYPLIQPILYEKVITYEARN